MYYNDFQDLKLSALGMGCMRLPVIDGDDSKIDVAETDRIVDVAMAGGVNYYDTAWGYHGGHSEEVISASLARYPRDSYYVASKFPGYEVKNFGKAEEIFKHQFEKTGWDHFDFYLAHNVCELNIEQYLDDKQYGTMSFLIEQRDKGLISHLGFSAHGDLDVMQRFLDAYGSYMEFGQIQLNYFDWKFQDAQKKVELLANHDIPVWVMEPLRGGHLIDFSDDEWSRLSALRPEETKPGWAFRFLQSIPEVTMTLSGFSTVEQAQQNVATFNEREPLSSQELDTLLKIADERIERTSVPCTGCHYCVSHCPNDLDIPMLIKLYNEHRSKGEEGGFIAPMVLSVVPEDKWPSACVGCKSCEEVCPQQIKVSEVMSDFAALLKK
jgi:predicted aldo/keto reductase-like oxidoreductase